jgi:hypothetical protein
VEQAQKLTDFIDLGRTKMLGVKTKRAECVALRRRRKERKVNYEKDCFCFGGADVRDAGPG